MKNVEDRSAAGFAFQLAGHAFRVFPGELPGTDGGAAQKIQEVTMDGEPFGMWPFEAGETRDQIVSRVVREFRARAVPPGTDLAGTGSRIGKGKPSP